MLTLIVTCFFYTMKAVRQIIPYLKGKWNYVGIYALANLLSVIFSTVTVTMISPFLNMLFDKVEPVTTNPGFHWQSKEGLMNYLKYIISDFIASHGGDKVYGLILICLIVVTTTFLKNLFLYLSKYILNPLRNKVVYDIRKDLYSKVLELPIGFFTNERKGDILSRMTNDVTQIEIAVLSTMELLFSTPVTILFYFFILSFINLKLFAFLIVLLPIAGLIIGRISKRLKRNTQETQRVQGNIVSILEETLSGLRIVKAFGAEQNRRAHFNVQNQTLNDLNNQVAARREMASPMSEFLGILILCVIIWFGGNMALSNPVQIEPGLFIVFISMFYFLINPLKSLSNIFYNLHQGSTSIERINLILQSDPGIQDTVHAMELASFEKEIEFKQVSFSYGDKKILQNIDLKIPKGKTLAIVGASGAGKSTLVDLIPRFHEVQHGEILIDGVNIRQYKIASLRKMMGIVSQEPILFNDSIEHNIALGEEEPDLNKVIQAARMANADRFILNQEKDYQYEVGDRGSKLSGGEKQRITIARALYKNPPILILDEATSSLDTVSEKQVQDAIQHLMQNRTSIVIAHRLSTVQNADEIIVLDQGKIMERGNHQTLMNRNGLYKKLVDMQLLDKE